VKPIFYYVSSFFLMLLLFFPFGKVESSQIVFQQDLIDLPLTLPLSNNTVPDDLIMSGNVILTGNSTIDPIDDGWLRLTTNDYNQTGYAYYDKPLPTNRGLVIEFDYTIWGSKGSTGGDGFSFFLFDGATTNFNPGGYGGSLGYAQRCGIVGLSNGYLGIGFDEFGNFSRASECKVGGISQSPDSIALRGPGNGMAGYAYLTGNQEYPQTRDSGSAGPQAHRNPIFDRTTGTRNFYYYFPHSRSYRKARSCFPLRNAPTLAKREGNTRRKKLGIIFLDCFFIDLGMGGNLLP